MQQMLVSIFIEKCEFFFLSWMDLLVKVRWDSLQIDISDKKPNDWKKNDGGRLYQ